MKPKRINYVRSYAKTTKQKSIDILKEILEYCIITKVSNAQLDVLYEILLIGMNEDYLYGFLEYIDSNKGTIDNNEIMLKALGNLLNNLKGE